MKIYLASDHAAFAEKNKIKEHLLEKGHHVEDLGPHGYDKDDDYPDYAFPLAEKVVQEKELGILLCGSGVGVTVAANKVKGARAAYAESVEHAIHSKDADNANILILDAMSFNESKDFELIDAWIATPFSNAERHVRRLQKIADYENKQ